ncbi:MAG: hypothetical protein Phog2KO_39540 [Phototrophicaceae bacterium]
MTNTDPQKSPYSSKNITPMTPHEHIRRRPGMYFGGTDSHALHNLLWQVVDNSLDEHLAGRCDTIRITLHSDTGITVSDNGEGIPVETAEHGRTLLELFMTHIGGGKFDEKAYKVKGGLHGVGVSAVNALSAEMIAEIKRSGYLWRQTYSEGLVTSPVEQVRPLAENESTGTRITFTPDFTIMDEGLTFDYEFIKERCQELAYLLPQLTLEIEHEGKVISLNHSNGIADWVADLNKNIETVHPVLHINSQVDYQATYSNSLFSIKVELALQFRQNIDGTVMSFMNTILVRDGGVQIEGLEMALINAIYGETVPKSDNPLQGLTAILNIYHPDPQFEGAMKIKLLNPEIKQAVMECVQTMFSENPDILDSLRTHFAD